MEATQRIADFTGNIHFPRISIPPPAPAIDTPRTRSRPELFIRSRVRNNLLPKAARISGQSR